MSFSICTKCERHVRSGDVACPFCGAHELLEASRRGTRVSRGAMIGAAAVAIACGTASPPDDGGADASNDVAQKDVVYPDIVAAYGGPPLDGSMDAGSDSLMGAYGGPPPKDSGGN
jgi:hypothetical protein